MWTFCVDYICTPDFIEQGDQRVVKLVGSKPLRVDDCPDQPRNNGLVHRRAEFETSSGQALLNKLRKLSKKLYTVSFVIYKRT